MVFTKLAGKIDTLEIVRPDGAVDRIECPKQKIIPHDMVHFAVESILGARGFLRAAGSGEAGGHAPMDDVEAEAIERLVETMQADAWSAPGSATDLIDLYHMTCDARSHAVIPVEPGAIDAIREEIVRLTLLWDDVPIGGTLTLSFEPQHP